MTRYIEITSEEALTIAASIAKYPTLIEVMKESFQELEFRNPAPLTPRSAAHFIAQYVLPQLDLETDRISVLQNFAALMFSWGKDCA
ncbi:MAG: hypothetical protein RMK20_06985 [Verrucomicrobiales bacterium]|nr:hypothetical protein [Verrucomicrobiales bacterium]